MAAVIPSAKRSAGEASPLRPGSAIDPTPMISGIVGFDRFPDAFDGLRAGPDSCKLLLKPN